MKAKILLWICIFVILASSVCALDWWNVSWWNKTAINLSNADSASHTNEFFKVDVSSLTGCAQADKDDIRVIHKDTTEIPYEWYNNSVRNHLIIPMNVSSGVTNNQDYSIYCGNAGASDGQDTDTFIVYDDFESASNTAYNWESLASGTFVRNSSKKKEGSYSLEVASAGGGNRGASLANWFEALDLSTGNYTTIYFSSTPQADTTQSQSTVADTLGQDNVRFGGVPAASNWSLYDGASKTFSSFSADTWYAVKLKTDITNDKYEISINGTIGRQGTNWKAGEYNDYMFYAGTTAFLIYTDKFIVTEKEGNLYTTQGTGTLGGITSLVNRTNFTLNITDIEGNLIENVSFSIVNNGENYTTNPVYFSNKSEFLQSGDETQLRITATDLNGGHAERTGNTTLYFYSEYVTFPLYSTNFFICENPANKTAFNFFLYDEDNVSLRRYGDLEGVFYLVSPIGDTYATSVSVGNQNNMSVCVPHNYTSENIFAYVKYSTDGGFTHNYYLINGSVLDVAQNFTIFNFNTTTGLSDLKITVRNKDNYNYLEDVIGILQRYYVGENLWRTVQMGQTGDYGLLFYNIYEETTDYRILFKDTDGHSLETTNTMKFVCTSSVCDLTYLLTPWSGEESSDNLSVSVDYDNSTSNITITWNDPSGASADISSIITKETMTGTLTLCNLSSSGASGSQVCDVSGHTGTFLVNVRTLTNGVPVGEVAEWIEVQPSRLVDLIGASEGALWGFIICLIIVTAGAFSPVAGIISLIFALIAVYALGIMNAITLTGIMISVVIGIVISFKIKA